MRKNHPLLVRFSQEEIIKLRKKAQELGLTLTSFIRLMALNSKVEISEDG